MLRWIRTEMDLKAISVMVSTSIREVRRLLRSYDFGTNARVFEPMIYYNFVEAFEHAGSFWGVVEQTPDGGGRRR